MKHCWLPWVFLLLLVGCTLDSPAPVPINPQTAAALTPRPTATLPATPTAAPTPTATATATVTVPPSSPTATATTASATPGLVDVSFCRRSFGPENGTRFSARLSAVRTEQQDQFEQVTFVFTDTTGVLHGTASCMLSGAWPSEADIGGDEAPGAAVIGLRLDDWAHDDLFAASPLTQTAEITPSGVLTRVAFAADELESRGALLGVGLNEPRPFRVRVADNELIVEVARNAAYPPSDDPLGQPAGDAPSITEPVFFLHQGDVYRFENGQAQPISRTAELETGLAVSPDGSTLAVCRAAAEIEPFALPYDVRATLWVMRADGSEPRQLADVGGCAEPVFATSGKTIAFTGNLAPSPPAVLQVWTVPVVGGEATPVTRALDEWNRFEPRWLADGRLVYRARNDSGQTVIFLRNDDGTEREITAQLLTGRAYRGVGQFVLDSSGGQLAVEALRAEDDGADLVLLRVDGSQVAAEKRGFWQRPLAFTSDGLIYLTVECPAETVFEYTVQRRTPQGTIDALVSGSTASGIGAVTVQDTALLYVRAVSEAAGVRGPAVKLEPDAASSLWYLSADGTQRAELFAAGALIGDLRAAGP